MALDLNITPALRKEGLAREIIKRIQTYRKENGFDITDHINITFGRNEEVESTMADFKDYIASQVLAEDIAFGETEDASEFDFESFKISVRIEKAN